MLKKILLATAISCVTLSAMEENLDPRRIGVYGKVINEIDNQYDQNLKEKYSNIMREHVTNLYHTIFTYGFQAEPKDNQKTKIRSLDILIKRHALTHTDEMKRHFFDYVEQKFRDYSDFEEILDASMFCFDAEYFLHMYGLQIFGELAGFSELGKAVFASRVVVEANYSEKLEKIERALSDVALIASSNNS